MENSEPRVTHVVDAVDDAQLDELEYTISKTRPLVQPRSGFGFWNSSITINIAKAVNKPILVRVTENEKHLKDFSLQGKAGFQGFEVGGEAKLAWERKLHDAGFGTIGPKMTLKFQISSSKAKIFVSLYEVCDDKLIQKHDNYTPPKSDSLLYTASGLIPSQKVDPFIPIITQGQAALIAKTDIKLTGSVKHKCGIDSETGDVVCWKTDQQVANKDNKWF